MGECRTGRSAIKLTLSGLPGAIPKSHCRPKLLLGLSVPISAIQLEKHGCIRNSHIGFHYQHAKQLTSQIELRDDLFVGKGTHFEAREKTAEPFSVRIDTRSVFLSDERQFPVCVEVSFDVFAPVENGT